MSPSSLSLSSPATSISASSSSPKLSLALGESGGIAANAICAQKITSKLNADEKAISGRVWHVLNNIRSEIPFEMFVSEKQYVSTGNRKNLERRAASISL
mmetsp:Transcript_20477/g.40569  ORF Transcript_20477/g.40569 Transcript_20477/m.40569 type:complete len:100 (-) Transcript_20477:681-980(-)